MSGFNLGTPDAGAYFSDRYAAWTFGISWQQVQARCRAHQWPHLRINRGYRFTQADLDAIEALLRALPSEPTTDTWGRKKRGAA